MNKAKVPNPNSLQRIVSHPLLAIQPNVSQPLFGTQIPLGYAIFPFKISNSGCLGMSQIPMDSKSYNYL